MLCAQERYKHEKSHLPRAWRVDGFRVDGAVRNGAGSGKRPALAGRTSPVLHTPKQRRQAGRSYRKGLDAAARRRSGRRDKR